MVRQAPVRLYRHRGYLGTDLTDAKVANRLSSELNSALLGKVWFSKLSAQNDPFDTNPHFEDSSIREIKSFMEAYRKKAGPYASLHTADFVAEANRRGLKRSDAKKHLKNYGLMRKLLRETFEDHQDNSLISCFTEEPDNILMWSYYSNSHCSFSYEFSLPEGLLEAGSTAVADVRYVTERPRLTTIDMMRRSAQHGIPSEYSESPDDRRRVDDATLLCKSVHWSHEKEWRALKTPDYKPGFHQISPYQLTGVVLGCRASRELNSFIRSVLPERVPISQFRMDNSDYRLKLEQLH